MKLLHNAAFHLGLQCLPKYPFGVSVPQRVKQLPVKIGLRSFQSKLLLNVVFLSLKIDFMEANSADPDEMPPFVVFTLCQTTLVLMVSRMKRFKNDLGQCFR